MKVRSEKPDDAMILRMKESGSSFSDIAEATHSTIGSVTGRYYRLKGVRHPAQIIRDLNRKQLRRTVRAASNRKKSAAAIEAAIAIHKGCDLRAAVSTARALGASFSLIGACLGISGQALHKKIKSCTKKQTNFGTWR
jgi:hypothetical protein